jgi:hypothetical protein
VFLLNKDEEVHVFVLDLPYLFISRMQKVLVSVVRRGSPVGRPRRRLKNNIKIDLKRIESEGVGCIYPP